jgi:hypothetical protein
MRELRPYLWEIFVYVGIGALALVLVLAHDAYFRPDEFASILAWLKDAPTPALIVGVPGCLMLFGALFEPLANYYEKFIFKIRGAEMVFPANELPTKEIENFIRSKYTDEIFGEGNSPFHLCKEFVESKGLSTTFMPFLSKFGFYRSVSLLFFLCFIWSAAVRSSDGIRVSPRLSAPHLACCLHGSTSREAGNSIAIRRPLCTLHFSFRTCQKS